MCFQLMETRPIGNFSGKVGQIVAGKGEWVLRKKRTIGSISTRNKLNEYN